MSLINNAMTGATAAQLGLNTTSQNVANVMTPGYTRQGVLLESMQASGLGAASPGLGVNAKGLIRFADEYKTVHMWASNSSLGQHTAAQSYLSQIEQVLNNTTGSISTGLDNFFSALHAASVDPTSAPLRQQVITAAAGLGERYNNLADVLANQQITLNQQRSSSVVQVNDLAASIANLNQQITAAQATGSSVSGLIDKRDSAIDALANLVSIQQISQPDGSRSVSLATGQPLVVGLQAASLTLQGTASGSQTLKVQFAKETFTMAGTQLGGALGGLSLYEQDTLHPMQQALSTMAGDIASSVNTQLAAGFTPGTAGGPLFVFNPTSTSSMLTVTSGMQANDLAFSSDATKPGDSSNLLALIGLHNQAVTLPSLGTMTLNDAYAQLVGWVGSTSQQNQASLDTAQTVRTRGGTRLEIDEWGQSG
ncbi:flagellar hook-associated protein FlgK [Paludibacterium denitrificans]|uniref:flagellar hook-associated protein FlgK n=1 Tax=Paludibacterium denitrificans TaxID=2675226 RepID=UPI001E46B845|nr:flagellar hook-associated protein FlgK [Paludibacterium denitrificans]